MNNNKLQSLQSEMPSTIPSTFPSIDFFGTQVTRMIIGDNPFNGHVYIPEIYSKEEALDYYKAETIIKTMFKMEQLGFSAMLPLGDPFILRVIRQYQNEGGKLNWIFQAYPAISLPVNIRMMNECKPLAIYHQGTTTDGLCEASKTDIIRENLKYLKDNGLPVGLGTHVPETVLRSEYENWGVDFYVTCLHNTRKRGGQESSFITGKKKHTKFFMEDRAEMFSAIRQVSKPCIAFKIFAGGQIFYGKAPEEIPALIESTFREVYSNIKPADIAAVGVFQKNKDELQEISAALRKVLH